MRIRTVKPDFFLDEQLCSRPPLERVLFQGLWCMADREGRLEDRPKKIKAQILPYDDCDVDGMLNNLGQSLFILRYQIKGRKYIQVRTFKKHQRPNIREAQSEIPGPPAFARARTRMHVQGRGEQEGEREQEREQEGKGNGSGGLLAEVATVPPSNGQPPQAASVTCIDHDRNDRRQAVLAQRCLELATRRAALDGHAVTEEDVHGLLYSVTTTSKGKQISGPSIRGLPAAWIEQSLRDCDAHERDLADEEAAAGDGPEEPP